MDQGQKSYMSTAEVMKTISDHLSRNQIEEAANLFSRCQEDIGYQLMSRLSADKKLRQNLVKMFFTAKDYQKAAAVCEELKEYQKAAQLYERCDDYYLAAEMYARVEDHGKAAEMFERYGDYNKAADLYTKVKNFEKAAQCFEKAINHFLAGKYYFHLKKYQKSMELLQKVPTTEESNYLEASILIGNILAKHGYLDLAIRKYLSVIKNMALDQNSVSLYYNLGILYAKKDMWPEAKQAFLDVLNFDFSYKDAGQKVKEVEKRMAQAVGANPRVRPSISPQSDQPSPSAGVELEDQEGKESQVVSVMDGFEFLKGTPLFENLSLAELKAFYNAFDVRQYKSGDIIIEQGVPGKALYVIKKGAVWIQRVSGDQVTNIVELPAGVYVGEMSLIDDGPTSARVTAASDDTEAFEITRDKFFEQLRSSDKTALKMYRVFVSTLVKRLRDTTQELAQAKEGK